MRLLYLIGVKKSIIKGEKMENKNFGLCEGRHEISGVT